MKLLYLDADAQYINPTAALLPLLMSSACPDIRFYGPGYSSREELTQGVLRWVDANGPFDAVLLGPWMPFFIPDEGAHGQAAEFVCRYTVHPGFNRPDLRRYFDDVLGAFASLSIPLKIVTSLALDTYAATQDQVDRILEAGVVLLGPNHQFGRRMAEWPTEVLTREKDYPRKRARLSDAWLDFLTAYPERVLTACHYIGEHEFCRTALEARRWDVSVPGVEYALRRDALEALRATRLRVAPKLFFRLFAVANRMGLPVYRHYATSRLYNLLFQQTLFTSRAAFTAASAPGNLIRKFLEIPAAGAVLFCTPCNGFDALGFEDGRNFVATTPADIARLMAAHGHDASLQRIANAGQDLVMSRHSMVARASQISRCLDALRRGAYRGAYWHQGEFMMSESKSAAYAGTA